MKPQDLEALLAQIEAIEQNAYELGFKSAGGSIVPGITGERERLIEVAFDQDQVDVILALAMFTEKNMRGVVELFLGDHTLRLDAALKAVIEKLAIHGSFKG